MVSRLRQRPPAADERLYLRARIVLAALLASVAFIGIRWPGGAQEWTIFWVLFLLIIGNTVILRLALHRSAAAMHKAMLFVLPPDLVVVGGFTYLFRTYDDAFYSVAILTAVAYALVFRRRTAWAVGVLTMLAYMVGHTLAHPYDLGHFMLFLFQSAAIPLIGALVASSAEKLRLREAETLAAVADKDMVNAELQQRVSELQAVSEITELIHSSLDFDKVGPVVLEIMGKLLQIPACCLFVIDKERSETLFSASYGAVGDIDSPICDDPSELGSAEHFACYPALDHGSVLVMLCASHESIDALTEQDRMVIGAVASELVVAVENSRLYKLTRRLAITDELTGLPNYRHLQQRLDEEIERAQRYTKNLSLLMIDADDFKKFNDTQGHMAGDVALADIGRVMTSVVREVDLVARYGGEEFSIVMPETDATGAYIAAEKVREAIAQHLFLDADGSPCCDLTVSIGIATYPAHADDKESLLREADDALYRAKHGGKNRVKTPVRKPPTRLADVD